MLHLLWNPVKETRKGKPNEFTWWASKRLLFSQKRSILENLMSSLRFFFIVYDNNMLWTRSENMSILQLCLECVSTQYKWALCRAWHSCPWVWWCSVEAWDGLPVLQRHGCLASAPCCIPHAIAQQPCIKGVRLTVLLIPIVMTNRYQDSIRQLGSF